MGPELPSEGFLSRSLDGDDRYFSVPVGVLANCDSRNFAPNRSGSHCSRIWPQRG